MSMDDNYGQMIFRDLAGLKLPDICLIGEEKPRKTSPRKLVPTGDRTRARCMTSAHAITCSTAVDASLDMEYSFGTETQGGSNNETYLSVSNFVKQCAPHYSSVSDYPSLPYVPLKYSAVPENCNIFKDTFSVLQIDLTRSLLI